MDTPADPTRTPTAVDALADRFFDEAVALSPIEATYLGVAGYDDRLDDLSLAGLKAWDDLYAHTLDAAAQLEPVDAIDEVTLAVIRERLGLAREMHAAWVPQSALNVIASPLQSLRDVFDLMPTATTANWENIVARMRQVPRAMEQYFQTLVAAADAGQVSPRRQVQACIAQCEDFSSTGGFFDEFARRAETDDGPLSATVMDQLRKAAGEAAAAYGRMGQDLRERLLPLAPEADACGAETYALHSRFFLGSAVDLEETYAWGQEELARITAEMATIAQTLVPGGDVEAAIAHLDNDPAYRLGSTDELKAWMQTKADEAISELADVHFDIPEPVRTIECRIAPTHTGGIYYTGPSEDFSRPGRMWWSVPRGVTQFGTWRELTTVYHEGVPGHHLQVGQTIYRRALLNRYRRMMVWCSGHGEGWALYSERLMDELGYLSDPGMRMGMLDAQSLRAARVVIDIGVHCQFPAPAEVGGGDWTYDKAWAFLTRHAHMDHATLRFELDRYLGWPGQAPSYKVGERLWRALRDEVRDREGEDFDLKAFHRRALDIGSVGLDTLREAVLTP